MIDLQTASFKMPIDDVFEVEGFVDGVLVTGHIEAGSIRTNTSVAIVNEAGTVQIACTVSGIISQGDIPNMKANMLASASEEDDDHWGIALIFADREVLNVAENGMIVAVE